MKAQATAPDDRCSIATGIGKRMDIDEPHSWEHRRGPNTIWVRICTCCHVIDWDDLKAEVERTRPVHYRAAADSLRAIAVHRLATAPDAFAHASAEGVKEAARLLERGLEDEGETNG